LAGYTLLTFANESGFSASDFGGAPTGMEFNLTPTSLILQTIPEPSTGVILLGGLGAIAAARRRKV